MDYSLQCVREDAGCDGMIRFRVICAAGRPDEGFKTAMILALEGVVEFSWSKRDFFDENTMQTLVGPVKRDNGGDQSIDALLE